MSTYTDNYGDELEIERQGNTVFIDAREDERDVQVAFDPEDAKQIAVDLYRAAGGDEGPVLASSISFNEGVIRLAAIHGKTVQFRYAKSQTAPVELRTFVPQSVQGAGDKLRFVGDDEDRGAKRAFRLDRIKGTVEVVA